MCVHGQDSQLVYTGRCGCWKGPCYKVDVVVVPPSSPPLTCWKLCCTWLTALLNISIIFLGCVTAGFTLSSTLA